MSYFAGSNRNIREVFYTCVDSYFINFYFHYYDLLTLWMFNICAGRLQFMELLENATGRH